MGDVQAAVADEVGDLPHAVEPAAGLLSTDVVTDVGPLLVAGGDYVGGDLRHEGVVTADDLYADGAALQGVCDDGPDLGRRRVVSRDRAAGPEDHDSTDVDAGAETLHPVEQALGRAAEVDAGSHSRERKHADAQGRVPRGPLPADVHVCVDHAGHDPQPAGIHDLGGQGTVYLRLDAVHPAVRYGHVGHGLERIGRIQDGAAGYEQVVSGQRLVSWICTGIWGRAVRWTEFSPVRRRGAVRAGGRAKKPVWLRLRQYRIRTNILRLLQRSFE